jgi:formylglycine-generating enzyme required for sulfatase activity
MKKLLIISLIAVLLTSCGGENGELVGVYSKSWKEPTPYGMLFINRGSFTMGQNDQDANWAMTSQSRTVSLDAFWMDETEITNGEYKQFVFWVRDSLAREKLYQVDESFKITQDKKGNDLKKPILNWKKKIPWKKSTEDEQAVLDSLFYMNEDAIDVQKQLNGMVFFYDYFWVDYDQAAKKNNKYNPLKGAYERNSLVTKDTTYFTEEGRENVTLDPTRVKNRKDFISRKQINIYPDTLCWIRDFTYAYNEPYMKMYFAHPGYGEYPVVGISWEQAQAFCHWRSFLFNSHQIKNKAITVQDYRLPTEAEWEYAARGGKDLSMYPWGGNYIRTAKGCFLANFKPQRGNYTDDGHLITAKVASYPPNQYGLYDMAGNVAEWTSSAYHESNYTFVHDMNPNYQYNAKSSDPDVLRRKVVRGGSWKDVGIFLQSGVRTYEYQTENRSFIGFRCVRSYIGQ